MKIFEMRNKNRKLFRITWQPVLPALILLLLFNTSLVAQEMEEFGQTYRVTGKVLDAKTKIPVPTAQIFSATGNISTIVDEQGNFTINLISKNDLLIVQAFDYNRKEVSIRGQDSLTILLNPDDFTGSYNEIEGLTGKVNSSFYTGSTNITENTGLPSSLTADDIIQARMSGQLRSVSRSGMTAIGNSLFIRGYNSIFRNSQPLFIVDGVIWDNFYDRFTIHEGYYANSLADIDINDIESISLVKDANSLYGSKAANGIIQIKTKRATDLATRISIRASRGITDIPVSIPMLDRDQFRIYASELLNTTDLTYSEINKLPYLLDDPGITGYETYHNITSWDDEIYRKGVTQSYHIAVTGGDDRALYSFTLGYTGNQGIVKTTDLQRLNMRFNGDIHMTDIIKMAVNIGFTNVDRVLLDDGVNYYTSPTYLSMIKAPFLSPYSYTISGTLTSLYEDSDIFGTGNPSAIIANSLNVNKHYHMNLGAKPEIVLGDHITLSSQFDYSLDKMKETYFSPMTGVADRELPGLGISENVFKGLQMRTVSLYDDTRLNYNNTFNEEHRLNVILGWRYLRQNIESDYAEGHNSGTDQIRNLRNEEEFKYIMGLNNHSANVSNYASIDYGLYNKYFLNIIMSMDASSKFGNDIEGSLDLFNNSWGLFPSVNAAWLVSGEKFMKSAVFVDRLKLRAGFAITGNDDIIPYAWIPYLTSARYMDRANGITLSNIGNSGLQWESTRKLNAGMDINLLSDRLALSADGYANKTDQLLYLETLPVLAGEGEFWNNGGEVSNKGFEFSATVNLVNFKNIHWEVGTNLGKYRNLVLESPGDGNVLSIFEAEILTAENNPAGVFYGYKTMGVLKDEAAVSAAGNPYMLDANGVPVYFRAGDILFDDYLADGIIDENDRQVIGDPNPDLYGSFYTMVSYRGLSLNAYFTYSYGNDVYNYLRRKLESGSDFTNQTTAMLGRWQTEGQETTQPRVNYMDPMGNSRFSDRWIEDGSYLKLKSLVINYKLPFTIGSIEGLELWVSLNDIWTLTNYLGRDPEVSVSNSVLYQGIDAGLLPHSRSVFAGIKLNL